MSADGPDRRQNGGAGRGVVDERAMLEDLRLVVGYASKLGLLVDPHILQCIAKADAATRKNEWPDVYALTQALNSVAALIAPITLADLEGNGRRNPFSDRNQQRSNRVQFWLTVFALFVLFWVVCYARDLKREQSALAVLEKIEAMEPREKLTELRKIAQLERPWQKQKSPGAPLSYSDKYHHKVSELDKINSVLVFSKARTDAAVALSLIPLLGANAGTVDSAPAAYAANTAQAPMAVPSEPSKGGGKQNSPATGAAAAADDRYVTELCEEKDEELVLPKGAEKYPAWMKDAMRDVLSDFCFQLKVMSANGKEGTLLNYTLPQLHRAEEIRDRTLLRIAWILPFLYGTLGATVFVMRNVANVRTPTMENFAVVMRLGLGGIAGIVVGWFAIPSGVSITTTGPVSLHFVLAFVAGYGVDILFILLDRVHRAWGSALQGQHAKGGSP